MNRRVPAFDGPGFLADPVASHVGPFVRGPFLTSWWRRFGDGWDAHVHETATGAIALGTSPAGRVEFLGDADLTDYHSPLGSDPALTATALDGLKDPVTISLDSLPAEALDFVSAAAAEAGFANRSIVEHQSTEIVTLPTDFEEWLSSLAKKDRHEVRRKGRRWEAAAGPPTLERVSGTAGVETFARLHRRSAGEKGRFMDDTMLEFFADLERTAGGTVHVLRADDEPVAAAFGFEDDSAYYLYNSAYEPAASDMSPGIVLVVQLIRAAIRSGKRRFDFLKGDEMYKKRMGARPRPLFALTADRGRPA